MNLQRAVLSSVDSRGSDVTNAMIPVLSGRLLTTLRARPHRWKVALFEFGLAVNTTAACARDVDACTQIVGVEENFYFTHFEYVQELSSDAFSHVLIFTVSSP